VKPLTNKASSLTSENWDESSVVIMEAAMAAAVTVAAVAREARAAPAKEVEVKAARVAPARGVRAAREARAAKVARVENQRGVLHDVVVAVVENRAVVFHVATRTLPTFT
jgi:hypothetical protein